LLCALHLHRLMLSLLWLLYVYVCPCWVMLSAVLAGIVVLCILRVTRCLALSVWMWHLCCRVSYIIYLTDPDEPWTEQEGGALELYPLEQSR
jgi:hypothetical protein